MFDLIKTFILGIWEDKKARYLAIFFVICGLYRFIKWTIVFTSYQITPVSFVSVQDDGALVFNFVRKYEQVIYPKDFQLPTRYGRRNKKFDLKGFRESKTCEKEFFKIYERAVDSLIRSSANKLFVLDFERKFPKNIGEASYLDVNGNNTNIYETLYKQGMIFDAGIEVDFCKVLQNLNTNN